MRVAFFEDSKVANFQPLALARPVFELVCGRYSLRERIIRHHSVTEWGVFIREHLAETYQEAHPEAHVNDFLWLSRSPTLVMNGRWLPSADALRHDLERDDWQQSGLASLDGTVAFLMLEPFDAAQVMRSGWDHALPLLAQSRRPVAARGRFLEYLWDLVRQNPAQLEEDFRLAGPPASEFRPGPQVAVIGPPNRLFVDPKSKIEPFVVLDVTQGPIAIGPGTVLKAYTHIVGPCHIDRATQLWGASVRGGSTIGPECRVGGEVETSILEGYVNKYHTGFLGHSYICPWANLGALTTTSDLKVDYSHVCVPIQGESVDSGQLKIGCFVGDHAKMAIGSLLNAGCSIGALSTILPDGKLAPKYVPSFSKFDRGDLTDGIDLEQTLRAARIAMGRRNCELTSAQERLWRRLYAQTREDREHAIARFRDHQLQREATIPR